VPRPKISAIRVYKRSDLAEARQNDRDEEMFTKYD